MSTINIKVVDQTLTFQNMPVITSGDKNIDVVQFDFCPLWDGFFKLALFFQQKGEYSYSLVKADGSCNVPNSIMALEGKIHIAVVGTNSSNEVRTTEVIAYKIAPGVADASEVVDFPTDEKEEEIYQKMLDLIAENQKTCEEYLANMAYVKVKGVNEFVYNENILDQKIANYTYDKETLDSRINAIKLSVTSAQTTGSGYSLKSEEVHSMVAITLTPGTYIVIGKGYFTALSTGDGTYRRIKFSTEPASVNQSLTFYDNMKPIEKMGEICQFADYLDVKETTKYYLCAQHDASTSITVHARVDAIRLR